MKMLYCMYILTTTTFPIANLDFSYRAIAQRELEDDQRKELSDPMAVYQSSAIGEGVGSGMDGYNKYVTMINFGHSVWIYCKFNEVVLPRRTRWWQLF